MVVKAGGKASGFSNVHAKDDYDQDGVMLFHVKGSDAISVKCVQVAEEAKSLNSGDCFVLITPTKVYVWQGKGSNATEKERAQDAAADLAKRDGTGAAIEVVTEGKEENAFWDAL